MGHGKWGGFAGEGMKEWCSYSVNLKNKIKEKQRQRVKQKDIPKGEYWLLKRKELTSTILTSRILCGLRDIFQQT